MPAGLKLPIATFPRVHPHRTKRSYFHQPMTRAVYSITEEPSGDAYKRIVAFCSRHASEMLLVVRQGQNLEASGQSTVRQLEAFGATWVDATKWPGTLLTRGGSARVYHIPINRESVAHIANAVNSLYAWLLPEHPEDLCFIRADGEDVLATISHERDAYLTLSDQELAEFRGDLLLSGLRLELDDAK